MNSLMRRLAVLEELVGEVKVPPPLYLSFETKIEVPDGLSPSTKVYVAVSPDDWDEEVGDDGIGS
jgi:hypothetical protein